MNTVIFLLNDETKTLLVPFTFLKNLKIWRRGGTWYSSINEHSTFRNIKVEWERLHELKNAVDKIPFLKDIKECAYPISQIQELLSTLKDAPLYTKSKSE